MAQKTRKSNQFKKKKTTTPRRTPRPWKNPLKDRRLHLALGFFLIVAALYLLIAFVAFLFYGPADQSVVESVLESDVKSAGLEIKNWLGLVGATAAHLFIFRWFGVASFLIPPLLLVWGTRIVFRQRIVPPQRTFQWVAFFLIWTSLLLGYWVYHQETVAEWGFLGGGLGYEMAVLSNSLIGWGTFLLLMLALAVFLVFFFDIAHWFNFATAPVDTAAVDAAPVDTAPATAPNEAMFVEIIEDAVATADPEPTSPFDQEAQAGVEIVPPPPPAKEPTNHIPLDVAPPPPAEQLSLEIEEPVTEEEGGSNIEHYDPTLDLSSYRYPEQGLLDASQSGRVQVDAQELEANKDRIVETLINFKIGISSIKATIGPTVTLYEIVPEAGIKISKIKNLEDDIALSLSALGIRIIAPIPGKGTIGIEVPNKNREVVSMHSVVLTEKFMRTKQELPIILGKTVSNELFIADLAKMPHLLIAGATGQGKSVGLNVLITSLIYKRHPSQLKFVLVDPKKVELSLFNKIERHFLAKIPNSEEAIITETKKVIYTLNSLCIEMDNRYDLLKDAGCRNIKEYNQKFVRRKLNPNEGHRFLPYIVLIIDELADLMMTAGKEVETPIARLAQLARAIGIHLVVATQRPSVNVITGIIKANFPVRLSFRVTSKVDSRTILDTGGAEQLVGMGDMLLSVNSDVFRLQSPFIDTHEVDNICEFIGSQRAYESAYLLPEFVGDEDNDILEVDLKNRDVLFDDAARLLVRHQQGSTSLIQRKLKLGYNRAGRLIDQLEAAGIVGPFEGSKAREVLVSDEYSLEQLLNDMD
ncbi:MAG: DNA translocase FtsK [Tunicatimonas sp.]